MDLRIRRTLLLGVTAAWTLAFGARAYAAQSEDDSVVPSTIGMVVKGAPTGVEVTRLREGGPAARAGVQVGDVVVRYNGETVAGMRQFHRLVLDTKPGSVARIVLMREGSVQALEMKVEQLDVTPRA